LVGADAVTVTLLCVFVTSVGCATAAPADFSPPFVVSFPSGHPVMVNTITAASAIMPKNVLLFIFFSLPPNIPSPCHYKNAEMERRSVEMMNFTLFIGSPF
jgi:hypothetical protein